MKIEILHFDKFKFDHEEQLHDIYIKRISQFRNIITDIKTVKINNKGIEKRIVKKKANEYFVSLDEKGEHFSTEDLKVFLFNNNFKNLKFIVGSTDGIQKGILEKSNKVISLSKMTLTHSFALIILLEQIYRSATIVSNHPYHRV